MDNETQVSTLQRMTMEILAPDAALFLVEIRVKPINNLKVFLDGDQGITIEKCVQVNRILYKKIEESGMYPADDFSLEVSSAGLDEPLKSIRQYKKNIGRPVEIILSDGSRKEGRLTTINEEGIVLEESSGKASAGKAVSRKQQISAHTYLFNNIKTTKIQVVF